MDWNNEQVLAMDKKAGIIATIVGAFIVGAIIGYYGHAHVANEERAEMEQKMVQLRKDYDKAFLAYQRQCLQAIANANRDVYVHHFEY